jgi:hypothetical protein
MKGYAARDSEDDAMKYMLMLYADERGGDAIPRAEMDKWMVKMGEYAETLQKAGAFIDTIGLARSYEATTVNLDAKGEMQVHDGPYAETQEQLGGVYIIEAADMAEAQAWAARCPGAIWGHVEVRPFSRYGQDG